MADYGKAAFDVASKNNNQIGNLQSVDWTPSSLSQAIQNLKDWYSQFAVNIKMPPFNAYGDGLSHPLSTKYSNYSDAISKYPFLTNEPYNLSLANWNTKKDTIELDSVIIQSAYDYAGVNGLSIFTPKGTYMVHGLIINYANMKIHGIGRNSVYQHVKGSTKPIISTPYDSSTKDRLTLENFYVKGDWSDTGIDTAGGLSIRGGNVIVNKIEARQINGTAFFLEGIGKISDCSVNYTTKYGYHVGSDSELSNNSVGCSKSHGFYIAGGNVQLATLFAWMCGSNLRDAIEDANGFYFAGSQGVAGASLHAMGCSGDGFNLRNASRNSLSSLVSYNNGKGTNFKKASGLRLYRSSYNTIQMSVSNSGTPLDGEWGWQGKGVHIEEANASYTIGNKISLAVSKEVIEPVGSDGSANNIMGYNDINLAWQDGVDGMVADNYPSKGIWAISLMVRKRNLTSAGNLGWACVYTYNNTTSVSASAGATSVTVTTTATVAVGDNVAILLDNGDWHFTTVAALPGGNTITLTVALPAGSSVNVGNRVHTNRWKSYGTVS